MDLIRSVRFGAAYDKRDPVPAKNYGIHGVDIRFVLQGEKGAVQFLMYTDWFLPETEASPALSRLTPMAADLGYHSIAKPDYMAVADDRDCDLLPSGRCYYDGSGLMAEPVLERLLREGDEGVWAALTDYYLSHFEED